jgi:hypothetical protein
VIKEYKRSWLLIEDSGTLICVNGSKIHGESSGWYDLDESIYKTIIATENSYLAIVFGRPEDTFVLPKRLFLATNRKWRENLKILDGCSLFYEIIREI